MSNGRRCNSFYILPCWIGSLEPERLKAVSGNPAHRPMSNLEREVELEPKVELVFVLRLDRSAGHRMCHESSLLLRHWTEGSD